jgi:hypothetical protein
MSDLSSTGDAPLWSMGRRDAHAASLRRRRGALLLAGLGGLVVACSTDDTATPMSRTPPSGFAAPPARSSPTSSTGAGSTSAEPQRITLRLADYAITPRDVTAAEGLVEIAAENHDAAPHNVAVLATDLPPEELPTKDIRIDESSAAIEVIGRTPQLAAHEAETITVRLEPGRYMLVCTVPHHYVRNQMVGVLNISDATGDRGS